MYVPFGIRGENFFPLISIPKEKGVLSKRIILFPWIGIGFLIIYAFIAAP